MKHTTSAADRRFVDDLEACRLTPAQFDHRAHVRAAYCYLVEHDVEPAAARMRDTLVTLLQHNGVPASKYHETITMAWILAVRHFMELSPASASADEFIDAQPRLLDSQIMRTHYSASVLFSPEARATFVTPDLAPIPRHDP